MRLICSGMVPMEFRVYTESGVDTRVMGYSH